MQALGIDHLEWILRERRKVVLVIVSTKAGSTIDFVKYVRSLITYQKLDRIIVDEYYLIVIVVEYRPTIVDIIALRYLRI